MECKGGGEGCVCVRVWRKDVCLRVRGRVACEGEEKGEM